LKLLKRIRQGYSPRNARNPASLGGGAGSEAGCAPEEAVAKGADYMVIGRPIRAMEWMSVNMKINIPFQAGCMPYMI